MKYHVSYHFRPSTLLKKQSSNDIKDLHKLKLLKNFDVNLTSSPGGVTNLTINTLFITPQFDRTDGIT